MREQVGHYQSFVCRVLPLFLLSFFSPVCLNAGGRFVKKKRRRQSTRKERKNEKNSVMDHHRTRSQKIIVSSSPLGHCGTAGIPMGENGPF